MCDYDQRWFFFLSIVKSCFLVWCSSIKQHKHTHKLSCFVSSPWHLYVSHQNKVFEGIIKKQYHTNQVNVKTSYENIWMASTQAAAVASNWQKSKVNIENEESDPILIVCFASRAHLFKDKIQSVSVLPIFVFKWPFNFG